MTESLRQQHASVKLQLDLQQKRQHSPRPQPSQISAEQALATSQNEIRPTCERIPAAEIKPQIEHAATQEGISPALLQAVAHAESGFVPCAVSATGASGLMQIMPATGRYLGLVNPWDPQQSLAAGAKYLRQLLDRYDGDLRLALGAYNAGPGRVDQFGDVPPISETQAYVRRILLEFGSNRPFNDVAPVPLP
jgi:soluble lytic murein transglycosylase-like protein